MTVIDRILNKNEEIIWRGKPEFLPFVWPSFFAIIFGLIFMSIPLLMFSLSGEILIFLFPHFWVGLAIAVGVPLYAVFVHKYVEYAITDKRIIIQKGLVGRDFDSVDYEKIQDISVNVGLIDKFFGTGTIIASSAGRLQYPGRTFPGAVLKSIQDPYEVYKNLKKVALDVKADIYFPTKYRPRENVGYRTRYRPRE